ncbi:MEDS domain-containing protein [Archangium lansingense]|uniref:MEDS domain-containing protein n=1 Tax=Archangium lansingense TaxID=2995310 RepID=A0ABT4A9D6_9BACT|nr:MEDS domain-containing protein [Archangium lansinium]MCY1078267.1 MEDS domain-containing protein [Archangium lansinium]
MTVAGKKLQHFHIAAFFRSREEEYEVLRSYIREGIEAGEKAVHICDPLLKHKHLENLETMGVPVQDCTRTGQLEVMGWNDAYLKEGRFDSDAMMALIEEVVTTSRAEGFSRVRMMGHMEWAIEERPGVDRFIEYEARVNHLLNRLQQPAICVYDLNRFSGSAVMDVLRTHPFTIIEGALRENPYYVPPEELLGTSTKGRRS